MAAPSIDDFAGEYTIRQGSVVDTSSTSGDPRHLVKPGRSIVLAPPESPEPGGGVLEFTLREAVTGAALLGPLPCRFESDLVALYHRDDDYQGSGQALVVQISLYRDVAEAYKAIYGLMIYGDPDNVGVWGADESG